MNFEKLIRIPVDRIGALIGKSGQVKSKIEKICSVKLDPYNHLLLDLQSKNDPPAYLGIETRLSFYSTRIQDLDWMNRKSRDNFETR